MTRGRKKDMTIPPSRALTQQRDYRARKAQYVADLEEAYRRTTEENKRLRRELELAKDGVPESALRARVETAQAAAVLQQRLASATEALSRFQALALSDATLEAPPLLASTNGSGSALAQGGSDHSSHLPPSPAPSPPSSLPSTSSQGKGVQQRNRKDFHLSSGFSPSVSPPAHMASPEHSSRPLAHHAGGPSSSSTRTLAYNRPAYSPEEADYDDEDMDDEEDELRDEESNMRAFYNQSTPRLQQVRSWSEHTHSSQSDSISVSLDP